VINIIKVGELKGEQDGKNTLTNAHRGQLEDCLVHLLNEQSFQLKAYGFLTNNEQFLVVSAARDGPMLYKFTWFIDAMFSREKSTALQALSWLANLSLVDHVYMLPKDIEDRVELKKALRYGSVGLVFHRVLKSTGESVVKKCSMN